MHANWKFLLNALVLIAVAPVSAQTISLNPSRDTTLYHDFFNAADDSLSNGAGTGMDVGHINNEGWRRALVRFAGLSAIPRGSVINSVKLTMQASRVPVPLPYAHALHKVLADWGEAGSVAALGQGASALAGDATWSHRFYPTQLWSTPGGQFAPAASASTAVSGLGTYTWQSTQMTADVQSWVDGEGSQNFGWIVIGNEVTPRSVKRFNSREHADVNQRPRLEVTYTAPATAVYVSGTSSAQDVLGGLLERYCDAAKPRAVVDRSSVAGDLNSAPDASYRLFQCTFKAAPSGHAELDASGIAGRKLDIYYTSKASNGLRGSITGVIPVLRPRVGSAGVELEFVRAQTVDNLNCKASGSVSVGLGNWSRTVCRNALAHSVDIGISEPEPLIFSGFNSPSGLVVDGANPPLRDAASIQAWQAGVFAGEFNGIEQATVYASGHAFGVSKGLTTATKPIQNLSLAQASSILSAQVDNWSQLGGPNVSVTLCRREDGSGTQAVFNAAVNGYPCLLSPGVAGVLAIASSAETGPNGNLLVLHGATSQDVKNCLVQAEQAGRLGVGLLSLEDNEADAGKSWRLIGVDGSNPFDDAEPANPPDGVTDRIRKEHLISGRYALVTETSVLWRSSLGSEGTDTADQQRQLVALGFAALLNPNLGDPTLLARSPGKVALPGWFARRGIADRSMVNQTISNYSREGNTCQPLRYIP